MIQLHFSFMSLIFSIVKSDRHVTAEILLQVSLITINPNPMSHPLIIFKILTYLA